MRPDVSRLPTPLGNILLVGAVLGLTLSSYLAVLKLRGPSATLLTWTPWDEALPFWPGWIWVYLLPYVAGPLLAAWLSRPTVRWFASRAALVGLISLSIFLIVPTRTLRPAHEPSAAGLTDALYRSVVEADEPPANAAPSLHVSFTCLMMLALVRDRPRSWPLALLAAVLVVFSTLLTRQHHLIDVVSGAALALLVGAATWNRPTPSPSV